MDLEGLVLWADEFILAINKPAGLLTLPDGYQPEALHVRSLLEPSWGRLWIVHRLDRDTSGALVLARTAAAHRFLNEQFQGHRVKKIYHALVVGDPPWEEQAIEVPLRANADRRHRTRVDPYAGKSALTRVKVLERFGSLSLIEAVPITGRTHQVRVHLAAVGFPVGGDSLYGQESDLKQRGFLQAETAQISLARIALHAFSLGIQHPQDGGRFLIQAPYPPDFAAALNKLRDFRQSKVKRI